jgi:hypothetical protein
MTVLTIVIGVGLLAIAFQLEYLIRAIDKLNRSPSED